ncbi:hypothetical protein [Clostridium grantii]|uniref:hypothetical protein n=1 Tax=Clostridium grantii TaxID=40575 RepID=UPI0009FC6DE6|nr:hypothetical protein [Clostridium grantii]
MRTSVKAPNCVEAVISKIRKKAGECGANPDMVEVLYGEMISHFIKIELKEFNKNNETNAG